MCPSYMATREEIHSTRGRARILFEALTTDLLPEGFADPRVKDALDLCLSCKGCKAECPSSVDMAAYRAEFFSNYYRSHRRPLSSAFFGRLNEVARLASYRAVARQCAGACAGHGRPCEKNARDSSGSRIAAFCAAHFPFVVRAQDGSQSEHARSRAVPRHLQQLLRAAGRNRRGRSPRARRIPRDHSARAVYAAAARSTTRGCWIVAKAALERRDGRARSIRRRRVFRSSGWSRAVS